MRKHVMLATSMAAIAAARPQAIIGGVRADTGDDWEVMLKKVSQQLENLNGEIKQTAEDALKQAKTAGDVSAETKATADKLLAAQTETNKVVEGLKALVEGVDGKVLEISQQVAEGNGGGKSKVMTLGQAVVAFEGAVGFSKGTLDFNVANALTTADGSAGGLIYQEEERDPVRMPRRRLRVRSLLTQGRVNSDQVRYRKQVLRTDGTGSIAETVASAPSAFGWEKAKTDVRKIGTHTNLSEEALADADQLQSEIDGELRYLLDLEEEKQIIAGDGLGENLNGLITEAAAFVPANGLPNSTRIDRLRLAILQITLEDYIPMEMLLNPTDWAAIEMQKDANERYIYGDPGTALAPRLWGKDVVDTATMSVGEWLVGDLAMAATFYDRQETAITMTTSHDQDFIEDMITVKARKRVAMAIKRALAMCKGNFTFV